VFEQLIRQPDVSALLGTLAHGEYALIVTLGDFTKQARMIAHAFSDFRLPTAVCHVFPLRSRA